eukprot:gene23103-biopygen1233
MRAAGSQFPGTGSNKKNAYDSWSPVFRALELLDRGGPRAVEAADEVLHYCAAAHPRQPKAEIRWRGGGHPRISACCPGVTAAGAVGTADCFATIPPGEDTVVMVSAPQHSANYAAIPGRRGFAPHNPPPKPPESHPAKPLEARSRQPQVGRVRGPAPARAADVPPAALSACPEGAMEWNCRGVLWNCRGNAVGTPWSAVEQ